MRADKTRFDAPATLVYMKGAFCHTSIRARFLRAFARLESIFFSRRSGWLPSKRGPDGAPPPALSDHPCTYSPEKLMLSTKFTKGYGKDTAMSSRATGSGLAKARVSPQGGIKSADFGTTSSAGVPITRDRSSGQFSK